MPKAEKSTSKPAHGKMTESALKSPLRKLAEHLAKVKSDDLAEQLAGTEGLRRLMSVHPNPPTAQLISTGIVPRLIEFLVQEQSPELQFEAAWTLTNIASGTPEQTATIVDAGAIPCFGRLLRSQNTDVCEQAIWALGNIAGDAPKVYIDAIVDAGAVSAVLDILQSSSVKLNQTRNGAWLLSNLLRGENCPEYEVILPIVPVIAELFRSSRDGDTRVDIAWCLSYIADRGETGIGAVIGSGVAPELITLASATAAHLRTPALHAIASLMKGIDAQTEPLFSQGVLVCLEDALKSSNTKISSLALDSVYNFSLRFPLRLNDVMGDAGIISSLIVLLSDRELKIRELAVSALSNAVASCSDEQLRVIVDKGAILPLCKLLQEQGSEITLEALKSLENILKRDQDHVFSEDIRRCGGQETFQRLRKHFDPEVEQLATLILERYFENAA